MKTSTRIGEYLIQRLHAHGVRHVFGIPGDYVLSFYEQLRQSKLQIVNTCDEQGAGFAADAYARVRGLGAVCVTYCVGGLKVANTTAEAFAEKSPVVVISGAPGMKEREKNPLLHHKRITVKRLFERLNSFLKDDTVVVADVGDALFGAADLFIHQRTEFLGPAYYTSMGFGVPAGIGAQLGNPKLRPVVLVGDGAFQMTGMELATVIRYQLNPIVIVLNNAGYGTERHMQDGPYNDVLPWNYHRLPDVLGAGHGFAVNTESDLECALALAERERDHFCLLDVHLEPMDRSPALQRLASRLAERI
ncbi:MAG: hypothetical protein FJ398_26900 [Verrucomicrobia bacterium]|nr:hypothetical protein [Verrucomicrobiota bacterium]